MSCMQCWLKGLLKQQPNETMQEKKTEGKKKNPHRQVTEFRIQAGGDALSSKSLQAKWSIWLPNILQYGPERTNKGPGGEGEPEERGRLKD